MHDRMSQFQPMTRVCVYVRIVRECDERCKIMIIILRSQEKRDETVI